MPDLVAQRRVYLSRGYAYVSQKDLASLVVQDFRTQLSKVGGGGGMEGAGQDRGQRVRWDTKSVALRFWCRMLLHSSAGVVRSSR